MASVEPAVPSPIVNGITKFVNCRLVREGRLVEEDICISSVTGKILDSREVFYDRREFPDRIIDLNGRIVAPGFIDAQLNGAFGFDFSTVPESAAEYAQGLLHLNKCLVQTGVTSYCPTVISQRPEVYQKVLPLLAPTNSHRDPSGGAESLGAHCEGPFLSPTKPGIHDNSIFRVPIDGIRSLEACYGASNLSPTDSCVKYITLAPELPGAISAISGLKARNITVSIGHSDATFEQAGSAVAAGASMITHLFNAMLPLHHRNPGIFGLLGVPSQSYRTTKQGLFPTPPDSRSPSPPTGKSVLEKPFFGIIADGTHLHPTTTHIAYSAHPFGLILVTDSMSLAGLPDGTYPYLLSDVRMANGSAPRDEIVKRGSELTLASTGRIAGSAATLLQCVNNFIRWTGANVGEAVGRVTEAPAEMLGLQGKKGTLCPGADADLVILEEWDRECEGPLRVTQVWKFGVCVFS